ncbi:alpha/beta fold hydrolase [Pseudonocardia nantongensis]|uniref:alpha/beta fold hydrolase n=1 Tax=Pseudonocardia nantongensis TaxID=1181885 RepID=UPI00397A0CD6
MVAPDYRGAGRSLRSRRDDGVPCDPRGGGLPRAGYDKWSMAEDVHELLHTHLRLHAPALMLGHDIGAMLATAYALRYCTDTRALVFGEAPLPGTAAWPRRSARRPRRAVVGIHPPAGQSLGGTSHRHSWRASGTVGGLGVRTRPWRPRRRSGPARRCPWRLRPRRRRSRCSRAAANLR